MIINALPLAFQGLGAVGGRADRRGDLRLAAAADDGRPRTAANGAAAHADSRHRGGPPHPVRPRRRCASARRACRGSTRLWVANINGLGGYFFRYLFTNPVPYRRVGLDAKRARQRRAHQPAPPRGAGRRVSLRWRHSSTEVGLMGPIARRMWRAQPASCRERVSRRAEGTDDGRTATHVVVVGVDRAERTARRGGHHRQSRSATRASSARRFDETSHTWTLPTCRAGIVVTDQIRSGREDLAPYLGVAVHGVPNYFMVTGRPTLPTHDWTTSRSACKLMTDARAAPASRCCYSTQRNFTDAEPRNPTVRTASYWRRMPRYVPSAFDLSSHIGVEDDVYDGAATIRIGDDERRCGCGCLAASIRIDGRYHWQGTIFEHLPGRADQGSAAGDVDDR